MKEKIKIILIIGVLVAISVIGFWQIRQEQRIIELEKKITELEEQEQKKDLPSIIDFWKPQIAHIICFDKNGLLFGGSGMIFLCPKWNPNGLVIITNKHVFTDTEYCKVKMGEDEYSIPNNRTSYLAEYDIGLIFIDTPTEATKKIAFLAHEDSRFCNKKIAELGDDLVVLGYPSIGTRDDITATKGIISGYEDYYYVTDAKIDRGNSGGAAILLKHNCYLGIPTLVVKGELESLGRILDFTEVILP